MKVLFVHNALRSFVQVDRDILASEYEVDEMDLSQPFRLATLPARLLRADMVFAWFASLHSLTPVLAAAVLGKPSVVVVGGYDTANLPGIGYGHMAHPWKRYIVRLICRAATALIANSETAAEEVRQNTRTKTPVHVLYHGFAPRASRNYANPEPLVLTVGNVSHENLKRKGLEVFVQAASLIPEVRFSLVGRPLDDAADYLRSFASPNVTIHGFVEQGALDDLMMEASVYVQASAHEGFGCSLVEAMMSGCMPVVSRRGALPEVAGEGSIAVDEADFRDVAVGIRTALRASLEDRETLAQRARTRFSIDQRERGLVRLINGRMRDRRG